MIRTVVQAWPRRRRVAAGLLLPLVATWFLVVGNTSPVRPGLTWYAVVALASVLGAGVLASYVPVVGRGLDLGCTPCATMSALTLLGATLALRSYGPDVAGPLVAVALLVFGLAQRMNQPATCATGPTHGQPGSGERSGLLNDSTKQ